jgi:hypothetical protein
MNVKIFIIPFITVMCLALFSCSQDEVIYSCDKEADAWVKENLSDIRKMDRVEWSSISNPTQQKAAYVAFSPEQKKEFWILKINETLKLDWNNEEKEHIHSLLDYINEDTELFERQGTSDVFELFVYRWIEYSIEKLSWSNVVIGSIIMTGYKVENKEGVIKIPQNNVPRLKAGNEVDCDCHRGNVLFTTCELMEGFYCKSNPCIQTVHGCGAFWTESCNGVCGI